MVGRSTTTYTSVPTTYTQDLAAPLPVVLQAKIGVTSTQYLFGLDTRPLAEYDSAWEYLLPDALGSVRQIAAASGNIKLTEAYEPYGSVLSSQGSGTSVFGFTGEQTDVTGLVFLRARYMRPQLGIFLARDPWSGDNLRPGSMNGWNYATANPVSMVDPTGLSSVPLINNSLHGKSKSEVFGVQRYGVARWGLYALIKDAKDYDLILPRYADFSYEGDHYPLAPDPGEPWLAYSNGCELFFSHPYWGRLPLLDFVDVLNWRAENWANTSGKGWRPNTLQFHWYETGGRFYSDFYKQWALPDLKMVGYTIKALGGVEVLSIQDRYGNEYMSVGGSIGPVVALGPEAWEGYARTHIAEPGRLDGEAPSESVLRDSIIQGFSIGVTGVLVNTGIGFSFGTAGSIGLFTDAHTQLGISFSAGHTWLTSTRLAKAWHWVDTKVPGYSSWEALDDK